MQNIITFIGQEWLLICLLIILLWLLMHHTRRSGGKVYHPHEVITLCNADQAVVVDIRDKTAFKRGHIINAIHLAPSEMSKPLGKLAKYRNKTLILVDKMGQGTQAAAKQLQLHGFTTSKLKGGMLEWESHQLPIVT